MDLLCVNGLVCTLYIYVFLVDFCASVHILFFCLITYDLVHNSALTIKFEFLKSHETAYVHVHSCIHGAAQVHYTSEIVCVCSV